MTKGTSFSKRENVMKLTLTQMGLNPVLCESMILFSSACMSTRSKDVLQRWRVSVPEMRLHRRYIVTIYCWNRLNTHSLVTCLNVSCQIMNSNRYLLDKESYFYAFFFFGFTFIRYCHGFIDWNGVDSYCEELGFIFNECLTDAPIHTLSRFDSIGPHNALVSVCVREEV